MKEQTRRAAPPSTARHQPTNPGIRISTEETTKVPICPASELGPGERRIIEHGEWLIAIVNIDGTLYAIEDRCSHDDGPLGEGEINSADCTIECPRHGSLFDLHTGRPKSLPAFEPVRIFPVEIIDDTITLEV